MRISRIYYYEYYAIIIIIGLSPPEFLSETFTIGYITGSQRPAGNQEYQKPGVLISGAISVALAELNGNNSELVRRGHRLDFLVAETYGSELSSVQRTAELWRQNVSVFIGPQETCIHEAFMAAAFNLPMISHFCSHQATSDKATFPTFARTRPPDTQISKSVAAVLIAFQWRYVALLYLNSTEFEYAHIATATQHLLESLGLVITVIKHWNTPYHHGYMENPFYTLVEEAHQHARIFVILGHHYEHLGLMVAMQEMGLFENGEYFVVGVDLEQYDENNPDKYMKGLLRDKPDPVAVEAYRNYLGIVPSSTVGLKNFTKLVNFYMEKPPFNYPNPLNYLGLGKQIRPEAAYLYDAVHLYARALIALLDEGEDPRNGTAIVDRLKGTHYNSAMGYMVYMDENGDAEGNYTLIARKWLKSGEHYGLFPVGGFTMWEVKSRLPILYIKDRIEWIHGQPPLAAPLCGFHGEKCITNTTEITSGVTGGVFLIAIIVFLSLYRNWRYEQELDSLLWKVDFREIRTVNENAVNETATASKLNNNNNNRIVPPIIRTSQMSLSSNADTDHRYSTVFTTVGIYRGRLLAIKKIYKKSIDITREMKKELKMMRDLRHDNLNAFIGACTDPPNICIVSEYCSRGSLRDILENSDVQLDNMFIASLVGDILRGMIYLHDSPIRYHGSLSASNCLVDSRWVVKLSDFGLREFKMGAECPPIPDQNDLRERCLNLLYKAPELLRIQEPFIMQPVMCGSQKGDAYSFGILLYETQTRCGPFGETDLSYVEILNRIIRPMPGNPPFRPPLEVLENGFDFIKDCLRDCWNENPDDRPDFKVIRTKLRPLRKGMKPNIFDNMMVMMQKYANNLEMLVDERTDQLQEEKKKTEALLYEMLPRPVAEQLKKGHKVEAEGFDCVTIFFSDIVGFTSLSAESTPLQVVNFLNDLYTCFDSTLEHYDVYKVETIGDAYMVVSGLPIRNGIQHASEIASMSLHLLEQVRNFPIRHLPHEKLRLRIGIHSGPVCAGVVGLKMPRYCLFGDTVNTASRMESTGCPLRIHCSNECKALLVKLGGYTLLERGLVPMKGKADQRTYWLIGEEPYFRRRRHEEREKRRKCGSELTSTRSSLKSRGSLMLRSINAHLTRCSSFETPKKLRFANTDDKPCASKTPTFLAVITDDTNTPRQLGGSLTGAVDSVTRLASASASASSSCGALGYQSKYGAASCPCIENLLLGGVGGGSSPTSISSAISVAQCQAAILGTAWTPGVVTCHSVPILCGGGGGGSGGSAVKRHQLTVPPFSGMQTLSAPVSPLRSLSPVKRNGRHCSPEEKISISVAARLNADSTPLLMNVTHMNDGQTTDTEM